MKRIINIFIISLLLTSCDILTTRVPEEPKRPSSNFIPATQPERLFQNLKSSIEESISENYMACFLDTLYIKKNFSFIPAIGVETQYASFASWNLMSEKKYFDELKNKLGNNSSIQFNYSITQESLSGGDSATFVIDYEIPINSSNSSIAGEYKGSAYFVIFLDSRKQWVIVEWRDIKRENFLCWSDLKGRAY